MPTEKQALVEETLLEGSLPATPLTDAQYVLAKRRHTRTIPSVASLGSVIVSSVDVHAMKGQLIRLNDGRPAVCVGGEDAVFCLLADLPQDTDSETKQVRSEMAKALGREATAKAGRDKAEKERAAMLAAVKRATSMLPHAEAQEVREVYAKCIS